jgi:hypothetical protein
MDQNQQILTCPTNHKKIWGYFCGVIFEIRTKSTQNKARKWKRGLQFVNQPLLLIPNDVGQNPNWVIFSQLEVVKG